MERLRITGGSVLRGSLPTQGAKNSCLPLLAATLLGAGETVFTNCPALSDVQTACEILRAAGCTVQREEGIIYVDARAASVPMIPDDLMHRMRSSIVFLGAMLSRFGEAVLSNPGGCELGPRPIDLHLDALRQMGAQIVEEHGYLYCAAPRLHGATISLSFPSVGATENILLAAVLAEGETTITNAAEEPEIEDLICFLNARGARIVGAGQSTLHIQGVRALCNVRHRVMPDRIWAATMLGAAAITGGTITLTELIPEHLGSVLPVFRQMGCRLAVRKDAITLLAPKRLHAVRRLCTMPYPGFPTDAQAPMMALLSVAEGTSMVVETIFENRLKHVAELRRMGADIKAEGRVAVVTGVPRLSGAVVRAGDLRGGAALLLAGLAAQGETIVQAVEHIDRGYQHPEWDLTALGARIVRETDEER